MDKIEELAQIIQSSQNIVFFGGAGVSTESGIPDFRSSNGIYNIRTPSNMVSSRTASVTRPSPCPSARCSTRSHPSGDNESPKNSRITVNLYG